MIESRLRFQLILIAIFISWTMGNAIAANHRLAPYKDKLFAYPATLEESADGSYLSVAYDKPRDIYKRDAIPLRKAKHHYVNSRVSWSRRIKKYTSPNGTKKFYEVGKGSKSAKVVVRYLHGQGGNRHQGVNDWTFGGNFNRLQNLMTRNQGILLTPDYTDFKEAGAVDADTLIRQYRSKSPDAAIIVACGSMGGGVCWRLANNPETAKNIDGLFILGSHWNDAFLDSKTVKEPKHHIPLYFGHGSWDPVFKPDTQLDFFKKIRKKRKKYPVRFVMFNTGKHGTPIRMVDWRREINWMLSLK